jgi:iron complex transport system permease protein
MLENTLTIGNEITDQVDKQYKKNRHKFQLLFFCGVLLLVASLLSSVLLGSVDLSIQDLFYILFSSSLVEQDKLVLSQIIWEIRLPRAIMALTAGAGLAVVGAVLQIITRNPLADPYLFGISSGASLGAVIAMSALSSALVSITLGAFLGGLLAVFLILLLAGRDVVRIERLLLSGVAVSFLLSAFTSLILYYSSPEMAATLFFWMMGSFSNSQWHLIWPSMMILFIALALFMIYSRWLVAIQAGDESAETFGIPVNRLRLIMLLVCAMLTSVLVANVGGIGFVGLMIPHICRFIVGVNVNRLLLMSLVVGGSFMIWVDILSRSLLEHQVLPIGIVTSAIGSFFFFIILKNKRNRH